MGKYKIVIAPDPVLETRAEEVTDFGGDLQQLVKDMIETMYENQGAGLAANQIGVLKRVLILDVSSYYNQKSGEPYIIINPEIEYASEETWEAAEGCLSFPVDRVKVTRPKNIRIKYVDQNNKAHLLEADGWLGRGILHEMDHLNGVTQLNYVSKMKRDIIIRKLNKYKKLHAS